MSVIFSAKLESNFSEFTAEVDGDARLNWSASAGLCGSAGGMAFTFKGDTTAAYCYKSGLNSTTNVLRARFYVDPNSISMATNQWHYIFDCQYGTVGFGGVILRWESSGFCIRGYLDDDAAGETYTTSTAITDNPHYVEIKITRAATNISADGRLDIWVDGGSQKTISGKDNYDRFTQFDRINFGAIGGVDATSSGTYYLDELVINNDGGLIGPVTYYTDTGSAISALVASGVDAVTFTDTGSAISALTASGLDSVTFVDMGSAISVFTASGADTAIFADTGSAVSVLTASGTDTITFTDTGSAISVFTASGADGASFTETGSAESVFIASGADVYTPAGVTTTQWALAWMQV